MSAKLLSRPAFPHEYKYGDGTAHRDEGMTLRDYFAAKAMQAMISSSAPDFSDDTGTACATKAYYYADAMLEARAS